MGRRPNYSIKLLYCIVLYCIVLYCIIAFWDWNLILNQTNISLIGLEETEALEHIVRKGENADCQHVSFSSSGFYLFKGDSDHWTHAHLKKILCK